MKSFSKLVKNLESKKFFKVETNLDLVFKADSEGDATKIAESTLQKIDSKYDLQITKIQEVTKNEFNELLITDKINLTDDKIINSWNKTFGEGNPNLMEKMEFYHLMRTKGFLKSSIEFALQGKI